MLLTNKLMLHLCRYLVLDIADNPVENIIRFFPSVSYNVFFLLSLQVIERQGLFVLPDLFVILLTD